jgi:hypothetical protein
MEFLKEVGAAIQIYKNTHIMKKSQEKKRAKTVMSHYSFHTEKTKKPPLPKNWLNRPAL